MVTDIIRQQHNSCTYGFALGLLTAVSPCPLATNIATIGFIGKDIENRRRIFLNGLLYTLGRVIAYTLLGLLLILILKEGFKPFRYSEVHRQIRRTRTRPCLAFDRFVHIVRR